LRRALPSIQPGELAWALACAAIGALGALPLAGRGPDPTAMLVWLALSSAPVGALAGATRMHAWVVAPVAPAVWAVVLVAVDTVSRQDLPTPIWAALAWTGLYALGFSVGRATSGVSDEERVRTTRVTPAVVAVLLLGSACLVWLPVGGGFLVEPWPPAIAARLLDLSPATLLAECAGLDWMRHPAVYEAAGAADIDPSLRTAYRGSLAAPMVLVVGCACVFGCDAVVRWRERRRAGDEPGCA